MPVPILITVAIATLVFGTDHPNGKWASRNRDFVQRNRIPHATSPTVTPPLRDTHTDEEKGKNVVVEVLTVTSEKTDAGEPQLWH